jgi:hypothetical protein
MSADTQFHETVRRWKQRTRCYGLAAVLAVMLCGVVAYYLNADWGSGPAPFVMDQGEVIKGGGPRQRLNQVRITTYRSPRDVRVPRRWSEEDATWKMRTEKLPGEQQFAVKVLYPRIRRLEQKGMLTEPSIPLIVYDVIRDAEADLTARPAEYAALARYARTGDPAACNDALKYMDDWIDRLPKTRAENEKWLRHHLDQMNHYATMNDPQSVAPEADRLMMSRRRMDSNLARLYIYQFRRAVFVGMFDLVRRYRMWLKHEAWWVL